MFCLYIELYVYTYARIIIGIPISLVIFYFQGRTLKNVKDDLLNDLKTLNSQYKMPATLSGKLNHFEKNYGRYTKAANDYCRLLVHCKKSQEIRNLFPNDIHVDVGGIGGNVPYILRSLGINTYIHGIFQRSTVLTLTTLIYRTMDIMSNLC